MKILYCIPGLYNSGGMERVLSCKANYLASRGYEISIVTTEQRGRALFFPLDERIKTYDLGINYEVSNGSLWGKLVGFFFLQRRHRARLEALVEELHPDVMVSMFGNDERIVPCLKDGSRKVLEYHFSKLKRLQYGRQGLWRYLDLWRMRADERIVQLFDRFVVLTEEDRALWGSLSNMEVIPNPLPFESQAMSSLEHKRVIAAGRYEYQKNFADLISIWAKVSPLHPDWRLAIYGDGSLRQELEALVLRLGLTETLSLLPATRDMHREYLHSAIYALTSHYEGLPMVLIEAQSMGLPIVSYTCQCGPRDIVSEGEDGFLVDLYDKDRFALRLSQLMADSDLRQRMGARAREASSRYELDQVMAQWEALFASLER